MNFFKSTLLITAIACFTFSCSSSDDNSSDSKDELAQEQNETENRVIPTSELESGIRIDGSTSELGTPPSPNGKLDFQINTEKQEAFQEAGLDIKFSTLDDIEGVYILFQDSDGNKLENYLDVPLSALEGKVASKKHAKLSKQNKTFNENEYTIDVDFDNILPGTFCYEICLYDESGNISVIEEICVEVEAWGGNSEIVGEWLFDRYDEDFDDEDETEVNCENGDTIIVSYVGEEDETWILALNADGSYYETYEGSEEYLNYEATQSSCSAVYNESNYNDKYSGKWAYNEDKQTLTIIDFKYENLLDASQNETYENGSVYFDGTNTKARVISGELVITDSYSDGDDSYSATAFFKRN